MEPIDSQPMFKETPQGRRPNTAHPVFVEGYMAGIEHPGFVSATMPDPIPNAYNPGTDEHIVFEAGFRTAIS
jgi:hypothetical protein